MMPKLIGDNHTFKIHSYKGIGRVPKGLARDPDPQKRNLLNQLPRLLEGYGKTFANYPESCPASVIVVCDLDNRCKNKFRAELIQILNDCKPKPDAYFCFAIEEGEAWLLGDINAIKEAYPSAKDAILNTYVNDSICGTWECLADAIYPGGAQKLQGQGWQAVGMEKTNWSRKITPQMDAENNKSPSFCYFRDKVYSLR